MTPQQQTDLNLWKQDQSQPLPKSLANALIEDCLIELNKDQKGYSNFKNAWIYSNDTSLVHISMRKHTNFKNIFLVDIDSYEEYKPYYSQTKMVKVCIIQTLLSRTPDGQAVMPFLDEAFFRLRPNETIFNNQFFNFNILLQIAIIRTCLSRVNGEAVLTVFGGGFTNWIHRETEEVLSLAIEIKKPKNYYRSDTIYILDTLYEAFDEPLRNGKPRDKAIQTLHDKMLELVPEYQEFLN
jgi:hypothetical protein